MTEQNSDDTKPQNVKLLFFSDNDHIEREVTYYDALLELKKKHPKQVANMDILNKKGKWKKEVNTFPCLLLIDNKKVLVKIEGKIRNKEKILNSLEKKIK
ncbi:hypothetical protein PJ311_06745 [Bacillus sp. CLL-7-23]|uniref:Thioredoxin domain-containing protein n=1 Tax=Bacillus changyiensis TaxID=3004103 RepID=A0ABT4X1Y4_9BACI|nr:hypothetical protein [Bacillus changyiensis]MDA7026313.1 hypothetical protein [Bacillus changyiensis]